MNMVTWKADFVVQLVPNITNITYDKDVGYAINQETFDKSITITSATNIRKEMGFCGALSQLLKLARH